MDSLIDLLGLPPRRAADSGTQVDSAKTDLRTEFLTAIKPLNDSLQALRVAGHSDDYAQATAIREKLYSAFQALMSRPSESQRSATDQKKLLDAARKQAAEIGTQAQNAGEAKQSWDALQPKVDEAEASIAELESAGHADAGKFRRVLDEILARANRQEYTSAAKGFEAMQPKLAAAAPPREPMDNTLNSDEQEQIQQQVLEMEERLAQLIAQFDASDNLAIA